MKKILIITYYWPPSGGPGVQRWLKFSKYLPEFGYDPIIITVDPEKAEYPIKDHTLEQDVRVGQIVYRTDCSGIYEYYKKLTKAQSAPYSGFVNEGTPSLKQKIARFIRGNFFLPDARRGWNKHAYHQAIQIIQAEKIDAVITTGPPMSTHLVGQKLKKHFHLHWIADFRDPWTDIYYYNKMYPTPVAKAIDRKYERNVLLDADQVVIAAGGGGIPVLKQGMELKGASAIIEKDYASGRLAEMVDADILLILTKDENLWLNYETEKARALHEVTVEEVKNLIADNEFPKASKLPKVQAAVDFIEEKKGSGRKAIITDLAHALDALAGKTGTIITE